MAYAYNPNYMGGRDQEDCCSRPAKLKSLQDSISTNKPSVVVCTCGPNDMGGK
jgi:hypothetical protein